MVLNSHRLLAPRPVFLIGSISKSGKVNIIPVTNIMQSSAKDNEIILSIYRDWKTSEYIEESKVCSVSPVYKNSLTDAWKLGAKYSGWEHVEPLEKLASIKNKITYDRNTGLPYLTECYPVMFCHLSKKLKYDGDHNLFVLKPYMFLNSDSATNQEASSPNLENIVFQISKGWFGVSIKEYILMKPYK